MRIEIREMPELRVGTVRHVGPYSGLAPAFDRAVSIAGAAGLFSHPAAAMMGVYHNDPRVTPEDQLISDAAVTVSNDVQMPAGLVEQRLPAGGYASAVHVGPYEQLGDAWRQFVDELLPAAGQQMGAGPKYERYLNDPRSTPKAELRTEMFVPLEPADP